METSGIAATRKPGRLPVTHPDTSTALWECCRITTSNGAGPPSFTLRDRATTIALGMLGHYGLMDKVFETPGGPKWSCLSPHG
jgi:hypothetical protein